MIKRACAILVLIWLAAAACTGDQQGEIPLTPAVSPISPAPDQDLPPAVDSPGVPTLTSLAVSPLILSTDRELYSQGERVTVTITNNADRPVVFMDNCSLNICFMAGKEWICVERECAGPPISLEPGAQLELVQEAQWFDLEGATETHSRYKLDYQFVGEEAYHFAYSNEFSVQKTG
jgi:hypothetical protein